MFRRCQWIPDDAGITGKHINDSWRTKFFVPDKTAFIAGHELRVLEGIIPSKILRLDKVTSEITEPRQITYVNSLSP